ncbi:hypothetical protein AA215_22740 [Salmonella enterica subsp. enterica serovar Newport]|nr:hypothetical protein [Salmonella enterica subsp. enterica serovar Newport]
MFRCSRWSNWLSEQDEELQEKVLADLGKLKVYGPELPRPYADTIKDSRYKNMKELRVQHSGHPVRAFYAFDPVRRARGQFGYRELLYGRPVF